MKTWAVITGAGTGIGAALAKSLAASNISVLAVGRRFDRVHEIEVSNPDYIKAVSVDIASKEGREVIFSAIPTEDKVSYLIQNAAVGVPSKLEDILLEDFEYAMAVNVTAPLMLTKGFLQRLKDSKGRVMHLGTGVAFNAQIGTTTYGVTKMAFHRLYEQLKVELKDDGVGIANILPGVVDTEGLREHIQLAKQHNLPHIAYFDEVQRKGQMLSSDESAKFIKHVLLDSLDSEYSREWNIHKEDWSKYS